MRHALILFALFPAFAAASDCRYEARRDFDVDAAGLKTLALRIGSSDLVVEGVPGLAKVEVRGRACASNAEWLEGLRVDQKRSGDRLEIAPHQNQDQRWSWFESSYAFVDLELRVPAALAVELRSGSGDARIRNVASLDYDGSSGDLRVDKVAGPVTLSLSSGDVDGGDIGSLAVRSVSSGDLSLRDIRGDVTIDRVGSGDVSLDNVGGSVTVGRVGSGDVRISHVDRGVGVGSLGSGDVTVSDVGGDFTVRSKGSGEVRHRGVRGKVDVPRDDD